MLNWQKTERGSYRAIDNEGNKWFMTANQECIEVTLVNGKSGAGFTEKEALTNARR
jgi:hypothetical protein